MLHRRRHHGRQLPENIGVRLAERARLVILDAKRADAMSGRCGDGSSGIEPDARISDHLRILSKALVFSSVLDDQHAVIQDRVSAERRAAVTLPLCDPTRRLEPLPMFIDQAEVRNRRAKHRAC